jgi:hypothetical protein
VPDRPDPDAAKRPVALWAAEGDGPSYSAAARGVDDQRLVGTVGELCLWTVGADGELRMQMPDGQEGPSLAEVNRGDATFHRAGGRVAVFERRPERRPAPSPTSSPRVRRPRPAIRARRMRPSCRPRGAGRPAARRAAGVRSGTDPGDDGPLPPRPPVALGGVAG